MAPIIDLSAFDLPVDRNILNEYFGVWAISADPFNQLVNQANQLDIRNHVAKNVASYEPFPNAASASDTPYVLSGGVAQIEIVGPMMKYASSMGDSASTVMARKQIGHAARNPDVKAIFIRMDSPGGTVSGNKDLADEVTKAKAKKPVIAFIDDLCASACYWIASQCSEIIANNTTALVGSIGTYGVIYDMSEQAKMLGIKAYVIGAGEFKGVGTPGTEVTEEHRNDRQRVVDSLNSEFKSAVAKGRSFSSETIDALADGRVHPASAALSLGLIDKIKSFDAAISTYIKQPIRSNVPMSNDTTPAPVASVSTVPAAATIQQIKQICSDPAFVVAQLDAEATVAQASSAYNALLKAENETLKAEREKAIADATAAATAEAQAAHDKIVAEAGGVNPLSTDDDSTGDNEDGLDPVALFEEKVEKQMAKARGPEDQRRQKSILAVAKANPELHQAFLAGTNPGAKQTRLLAEKYN